MGRATRWLKSLLGGKKDGSAAAHSSGASDPPREKKRWSFTKPPKDGGGGPGLHGGTAAAASVDSAWLRNYYNNREKEQSKHAIAVAAATAAAADAAVAAAQAAVEVVRLTSQGTGPMFSVDEGAGGDHPRRAAVKIQTAFRAYLAKKALRALKALVKLQALVRGYLVRKQAAATLHSMQALIRAQAAVRLQRSSRAMQQHMQMPLHPTPARIHSAAEVMHRPRRSATSHHYVPQERFDETRSEHAAPSYHSRRLSANLDHHTYASSDVDSPKIVEVDPGRPKTSASRTRRSAGFGGGIPASAAAAASSDSTTTDSSMTPPPSHSSPLPHPPQPARLIIPSSSGFHDPEWCLTGDECRFSTAQSTPRFSAVPFSGALLPPTPAKSVCGGGGRYYYNSQYQHHHHQGGGGGGGGGSHNHPNYMSNTQSFNAKVRSQSAPKQRPDPRGRSLQQYSQQRMSLSEAVTESRASLSGVRMQRNCSRAQEALSFKNAIAGRLVDRSAELAVGNRDAENVPPPAYDRENSYYYYSASLQRRW